MNIIITSELRVGSRWLHYLLKDLYSMEVSGEIDTTKVKNSLDEIKQYFQERRIVKLHHASPKDILNSIKPRNYFIIGVVRNPRDRAVSRAFHRKYSDGKDCEPQFNDWQAVRYTVLESEEFKNYSKKQFGLMPDGYATRNKVYDKIPYIWTSYEWLLQDTMREVRAICRFLNNLCNKQEMQQAIRQNSFETKASRKPGVENRKDQWRRKGVMADWINWFTEEMVECTSEEQEQYWHILTRNSGRR